MTTSYTLTYQPTGLTVATVTRLDGWWAKGVGVLGMASLPPGTGVWLPDVSAVHTMFVRFPLDLLFLDAALRTIRVLPAFAAGRPLAWASGARHTLELGAGSLGPLAPLIQPGDPWTLCPAS